MENTPGLDCIETRLCSALPLFLVLSGISEQATSVSYTHAQIERLVKEILRTRNERLTAMPAFLEVQNWVEVHWNSDRQTQPPAATVSIGDSWGQPGEIQLDGQTATCKLLLAAAFHGAEKVAKCAMDFAAHGMIEVRSFYLLKGRQLANAKSLDDYCTLLPYKKALQKLASVSSERYFVEGFGWPSESADCVCVLETTGFELRGFRNDEFERRESRLLQCGIGTLVLILGLAWGRGFRVFGNWHGVESQVAATLPFFHTTAPEGRSVQQTLLTLTIPGLRRNSTVRPLNHSELEDLISKYAALPVQTQRVLDLAMRRLRDGAERIELEDWVIDICIALEALFMEGERPESEEDRLREEDHGILRILLLKGKELGLFSNRFYDERSAIVHGNTPGNLTSDRGGSEPVNASPLDRRD